LRASQHPVDHKGVGVGANLDRDIGGPPYQSVANVSPRPKTLLGLERAISTCCLTPCRRSERDKDFRKLIKLSRDVIDVFLDDLNSGQQAPSL
jgi:hypothetical protein